MDRGPWLERQPGETAARNSAGLPDGETLLDVAADGTGEPGLPATLRLELVELPLDQIVTDAAERDASDALREELEEDGALRAIDVRARPDGRYDLVDGSRRLDAARALGQATITAPIAVRDGHRFGSSVGLRGSPCLCVLSGPFRRA